MNVRFQPRTVLTLFFIAVFTYIFIEAEDMPRQAKMYPWTVSLIALVLLTFQLVREVFFAPPENSRETGADVDFTEEEASAEGKRRTLELFLWVYGFALALWFLGFFVAIPVMVFLYLVRHREGRIVTIAMPAVAGIATWALFNNLLHLPFPPGELFETLGFG